MHFAAGNSLSNGMEVGAGNQCHSGRVRVRQTEKQTHTHGVRHVGVLLHSSASVSPTPRVLLPPPCTKPSSLLKPYSSRLERAPRCSLSQQVGGHPHTCTSQRGRRPPYYLPLPPPDVSKPSEWLADTAVCSPISALPFFHSNRTSNVSLGWPS